METYMGQLMGSGKIPLKYIIRSQALADPNTICATPQAQWIAGDAFNRDNAKVYGLIKQLVLEGPGQMNIMC
jgi:hypothetical protein